MIICKFSNKQKCGIHLQFAESAYICGFRIQFLRIPLTFAGSHYIMRIPLTFCGIQNNLLYLLVAESATKQMCRQNLRYRQMYAEFAENLFVEFSYILEPILRLVSRIQDYTDTQLCSCPVNSLALYCESMKSPKISKNENPLSNKINFYRHFQNCNWSAEITLPLSSKYQRNQK